MTLTELQHRFSSKQAVLGVIGLGYVGLPLVHTMAKAGYQVIGIDTNVQKVNSLIAGISPLSTISSSQLSEISDTFTPSYNFSLLETCDAICICVPTPIDTNNSPDLRCLFSALSRIAPYLRSTTTIILESTVSPGTTEDVVRNYLDKLLKRNKLKVQVSNGSSKITGILLGFSPERENPGSAVDRTTVPKLVSGCGVDALAVIQTLYGHLFSNVVPTDSPKIAEMAKLLENVYRCVNIALIQEVKAICKDANIDVWKVIAAAATKPYGFMPFYPSAGVGGHCIPIDPYYMVDTALQNGTPSGLIDVSLCINNNTPVQVVNHIYQHFLEASLFPGDSKNNILVVGVAYKAGVDDCRESPGIRIMELLLSLGFNVEYADPLISQIMLETRHGRAKKVSRTLADMNKYSHILLINDEVSHAQYYNNLYELCTTGSITVFDTKNILGSRYGYHNNVINI